MKIIVAIDSFKGSITSYEAGNAIKAGILESCPEENIKVYPVADGGEGTLEALSFSCCNEKNIPDENVVMSQEVNVTGPLGDRILAKYYILCKPESYAQYGEDMERKEDKMYSSVQHKTAIIEMSSAAGLPLVPEDKRNPLHTTTYGVGEMIRDAIGKGCRDFIIGIGGSATNDGGIGMLQALGYRFVDGKGNDVPYGGAGLEQLQDIYFEDAMYELSGCTFRVACDVTNPLTGKNGSSYVFSPQKGATPDMIVRMDNAMTKYANLVEHVAMCDMGAIHGLWSRKCEELSKNKDKNVVINRDYPGAGAAGGLGYAFLMFLNGTLESGVDIVLSELGIEEDIKDADLVITGEGKIDSQSINGKTPIGVARLAKKYGKKVIAFAGLVDDSSKSLTKLGLIDEIYEVDRKGMDLQDAMKRDNAIANLKGTVKNIFASNINKFGK